MSDLAADLELAASLVRGAGQLAARMRLDGLAATAKGSLSDIVTAADHAAEALVVARLRDERPHDGILGEEGAAYEGTSGRTWVIDPVDGTWNFFHGLDWWCSAIALTTDDDVLLGAVHHPATSTTYAGGPGAPATRNGERGR
jgi:myo-inositol-1(or 4)-monophosphatase